VALVFSLATVSIAANRAGTDRVPEEVKAQALVNYGKLPLSFEENRGQAEAPVKYLSQGNDYSILLAPSEVFLNLRSAAKARRQSTIRMSFPGAKSAPAMAGGERQSAVSSYFIGNDPAKWVKGAPNFARVKYREVYPGVDLAFYGNQGQLEYDFVVAPGANPGAIRLQFDGVNAMRTDSAGNLVLSAANGEIVQHKPIVYQEGAGGRQIVDGRYVVQAHNRVAFEIARYDNRKPLVIDPTLTFGTYLGSPGEDVNSISAAASAAAYPAVAVDLQGNVYVAGYNGGSATNFTGDPGKSLAGGGTDVFIVKMNPTGTALLYSVVFGGGFTDVAGGIAVDTAGNAYVTGRTDSINFPVTPGVPQSGNNGGGGYNAFVTEVNAAGTGLVYSTYLGGSGNFYGNAIAVDSSGNAYVTGSAAYSGSTPFPLVSPISSSPSSGFLTEIKAGGVSGYGYSTYLPAGIGYGIAVDASDEAYVTGSTGNIIPPAPAQGYVLKVYAGGTAVAWTTNFGNSGATLQTIGFGITLDAQKNVYVAGMTNDPSLPQITSSAPQKTYGGGLTDGFAAKLNSSGVVQYATYIGGLGSNSLPERGSGIAVDLEGNAYVSGTTQCIGFPTVNSVSGARNGSAAVLMKGTISGITSNWSPTSLAGSFDQVTALAFDPAGDLYAGTGAVNAAGGGVYKLASGSSNWTNASSGITTTTTIDAIAVDPNSPSTVYAAGNGHLYQTTNGGTNWTQLSQSIGTAATIAIAKTSPNSTVYVGSGIGLIYSTNAGVSWSNPITAPGSGAVNVLIVDPNNSRTAYAGTPAATSTSTGVYQTVNGGANWALVGSGLPTGAGGNVTGLAINQATATIYAATPNGLYYTTNAGTSWQQATLNSNNTPLLVAVDNVSDEVYVTFPAGLATGTNGGTAQNDWGPATYNGLTQNPILALAVAPGGGTAYAGTVAATTAFLTELNPSGALVSSTCIGGSDNNLGQSIAVTPGGSAVVSGLTYATNFPTTPGAVQPYSPTLLLLWNAFVMGINTNNAAITSSPSGASITVAGSGCAPGVYTTPAYMNWNTPVTCTVTFTDPQKIAGLEYEFQSSTVNGSAISHTNPISVSFSGGTVSINAVFSAVGSTTPGTATHFSVSAPSTATAGLPIQFTVTALNASNQTATTYTDPVHFTSTDPAATVPADAALSNGVGKFSASLVTPGTTTLTASDLLSSSITGTSGSIAVSQSTSGLRFISIPPCRVVDTRDATKPAGFGPPSLVGEASRSFTLPNGPCGIPATAQAYSLNVTVVPQGELGYLTVWPTGQSQPLASTLNSLDGEVQANAAIVAGGTGGAISVFATNNTDLVLDINGYFVANTVSSALGFYPMAPCRLVDTRPGAPSTIITGALVGGTSTTLPIVSGTYTGSSPLPCDVPATAQAYSLNFTLIPPGPVGYLTVYPTGEALPTVSTLNDPTGAVQANAAIAPAGTGGSINAFVTQTTDLVVDINGYFAPVGAGALSLYALPPCRVLDTRNPAGAPPFEGTINVNVLGSGCGGTSAAEAYVFNATVVPDGFLGYLTLWPQGSAQPLASTLNAYAGAVTSNMAIVPTSNTEISAFATSNTYLVLDLFGYFAP
jgi:hypothetical protein